MQMRGPTVELRIFFVFFAGTDRWASAHQLFHRSVQSQPPRALSLLAQSVRTPSARGQGLRLAGERGGPGVAGRRPLSPHGQLRGLRARGFSFVLRPLSIVYCLLSVFF